VSDGLSSVEGVPAGPNRAGSRTPAPALRRGGFPEAGFKPLSQNTEVLPLLGASRRTETMESVSTDLFVLSRGFIPDRTPDIEKTPLKGDRAV
jgi:hypothetical protein